MTSSERKRKAYEKLKEKESEKIQVCCTIKTLLNNCCECPFVKRVQYSEEKYSWICEKKARKNIDVFIDDITSEEKAVVGYYPYGIVNGKCDNLALMRLEDEFDNFR